MTDCSCNNFPAFLGNVTFGASVGIGTTAPTQLLHIASSSAFPGVLIQGTDPASGVNGFMLASDGRQYNLGVGGSQNPNVADKLFVYDGYAPAFRLVVDPSGNVGIGTTTPQQPLSVGGGANLDQYDANNGTPDLRFGNASGEGIGSTRVANGPNHLGLDLYTNGASRMSIGNNGQRGVGTNNPVAALHIENSTAPQLVVRGDATTSIRLFPFDGIGSFEAYTYFDSEPTPVSWSRVRLTIDGVTAGVIADAGGNGAPLPLQFSTGGAERMRIDLSGNVGIGTNNPAYTLDVASGTPIRLSLAPKGGGQLLINSNPNDNNIYVQAFSSDMSGPATALRFTGPGGGNMPLLILQAAIAAVPSGSLGVNTSTPQQALDVRGTTQATTFMSGGRTIADAGGCYYV